MVEQRVKEIVLKAKKSVFTGNIGNHLTAFKGDGIDFAEIREYSSGDDVRKINWKATAKSGSLKLNEFNEERELHIVVVSMLSGGLTFGTKRSKQDVVAELLALVGFSAVSNGDRLEIALISDKVERHFKPTKSSGIVEASIYEILSSDLLDKQADYKSAVEFLQGRVKRGAIVVVIGDFYEDLDLTLLAKHQLYAIRVRDHFEENPNINGELGLIDPATKKGTQISLDGSLLHKFREELKEHDRKIDEHIFELGAKVANIYTDEDTTLRAIQIFKS